MSLKAGRLVTGSEFNDQPVRRAWIYLKNSPEYDEYFTPLEYPEKTQQRLAKKNSQSKEMNDDRIPTDELYALIALNVYRLHHYSRFLHAFSADIDATTFKQLLSLPIVEKIELVKCYVKPPDWLKIADSCRSASARVTSAAYEAQLEQINVPAAQALGYTGDGVRIGIIDTGFSKDQEVFNAVISSGRLIAEYDFINDDDNVSDEEACDTTANGLQSEHGTAVWSLVGGYYPPAYLGVAYGAEFLLAKTERVDDEIHREEDDFVAAVEWCDYWGADIVSVSVGYRDFGREENYFEYSYEQIDGQTAVTTRAVNWAFERGILFVCCAGNDAQNFADGGLLTPGDAFGALTVGAVDAQGTRASSSSHGPTYDGRIKPDLCARGVAAYYASSGPSSYRTGNGTSFATPLVAGAAALLLESQPELTPAEIISGLKQDADRSGNPNHIYGWGIPDVYRSIVDFKPTGFPKTTVSKKQIIAYPNPANNAINFYFIWHKATPSIATARLQVYNLRGRIVFEKTLSSSYGGKKEIVSWDLMNQSGAKASSGIYFVRLQSPDYLKTAKFMVMH